LDFNLGLVTKRLLLGKVIPFVGAGANLCGREPSEAWRPGVALPSGSELAAYLIGQLYGDPKGGYPPDEPRDLVRVSQFVGAVLGSEALQDHLREVFDYSYEPNLVHRFLARLPRLVMDAAAASDRPGRAEHPLIVTTNYDDALERAFEAEGQPYDLLAYVARGRHRGRFMHRLPDGSTQVVSRPNSYRLISLQDRTVILKIHGAVDRTDPAADSYVITEDDYIGYLARPDRIPAQLLAKMRQSHFLFLGYGMRDWNLRVILHRIWGQERLGYGSWSVQVRPSRIDREVWQDREVEILDMDLGHYVEALSTRLEDLGHSSSAP
jgi:hypothetical protein